MARDVPGIFRVCHARAPRGVDERCCRVSGAEEEACRPCGTMAGWNPGNNALLVVSGPGRGGHPGGQGSCRWRDEKAGRDRNSDPRASQERAARNTPAIAAEVEVRTVPLLSRRGWWRSTWYAVVKRAHPE